MARKQANPFLKTRDVDGIEVTLDTRALEDMRFFKVFTRLNELDEEQRKLSEDDSEEAVAESGRLSIELMDVLDQLAERIFGSRLDEYQTAIADRNGGYLVYPDWLGFVMDTVLAFTQKNAEARPSADGD